MPRYVVKLRRPSVEFAEVVVDAKDPYEAEMIALDQVDSSSIDWRDPEWTEDPSRWGPPELQHPSDMRAPNPLLPTAAFGFEEAHSETDHA